MEEWMVKLIELADIAKLTTLIKEETLSNFLYKWKPLWDFFLETNPPPKKNVTLTFGFDE